MTIILFLIDTSSSMNQRTYIGTSLIDVAKAAVETFMKIRSRDPVCRWDRYMLLTFEEPPANVKAGWKESHATFMNELKNLKADGLTVLGASLKHAFDLLNMNRMQSGIDTYGQGRCPFYLEPAVIVLITDRGRLTSPNSVQLELNLPMNSVVPGCELTKEPFRWDQRIFGLVLEIPATPPVDNGFVYIPVAETHPINAMCDVTGGRSYAILSQKMLNAALESLVQKVQAGVVINFEKIGPDPKPVNEENGDVTNQYGENDKREIESPGSGATPAWHSNRKLIYVQRSAQKGYSVGHWPIPEAYWPDSSIQTLSPRTAQPVVQFSCTACEPLVIDNLPFDKYELEPSPLTQYILERKQPNNCWQVFVSNSAKFDFCHPFGYVKASSNLSCVNLFVMPYNYPVLLPLLDELFKVHKSKPTKNWRQQFDSYLKTMPVYYAGPLRKALQRMGAPSLIPDNMENCLSYSVITYLKKLKNQAKIEMDRLIASVGQKLPPQDGLKVNLRTKASIIQRKDFNQLLQTMGGNMSNLRQELFDYNTFTVAVQDPEIKPQYFRNPFDIPRKNLLDQISRMRTNFLQVSPQHSKLIDDDYIHSIPVQQMGNYQEYLKKMPATLREIETQPVRLHMFGFQEVIDLGGEAIKGSEYFGNGRVTEFKYGAKLGTVIRKWNGEKMSYLKNWGEGWGLVPSDRALVFVDNHDNQRGHGAGGSSILTFWDARMYKMAVGFMLAHPYGFTRVMSSYRWNRNFQNGKDQNDWIGPPNNNGVTKEVTINADTTCGNDWVCEHRWRQIRNMVAFRNVVNGQPFSNWWDNNSNQVAFSRGNRGFIVFNNDDWALSATLQTGLPAGTYCDVISGDKVDGNCTGLRVNVGSDGKAHFSISNSAEDPFIAIHADSKL